MIKILDKHVAEKIAAGEVVERPFSIVKELVENSIDAGADSIVVEIRNGGKSYIRVTDNGCGIPQDQVLTAFERHATSKISTDVDLDNIETLGFRGEALACISAVSKCELITKTESEKAGTKVLLVGSDAIDNTTLGCPEGTTIIVTDLFFNTPARHKFMRTDAVESSLIIDFISKMAVAYSNIKIRLISNGNILFSTQGKGDVLSSILTVYSSEIGKNLVPVLKESEEMSLYGYVSPPSMSKSTRKKQILFVNGRHISSKVMDKGISDAFSDKLASGKYPVCFLFLKIPPEKLDVNIHPNKKEVRFDDELQVTTFITKAINEALASKEALPEIKAGNIFSMSNAKQRIPESQNDFGNTEISGKSVADAENESRSVANTAFDDNSKQKSNEFLKGYNEQLDIKKLLSTMREEETVYEVQSEKTVLNSPKGQNDPLHLVSTEHSLTEQYKVSNEAKKEQFNLGELTVTGSIFATYITAIDDSALYFIDQHAAHERIFYEKLLKEYQSSEKSQQLLMIPFVVNVTFAANEGDADWNLTLQKMGFEIEEFGPKAYIVKAIPMFMTLENAQEFLEQFFDNITENTDFENSATIEKLITNACKFAIKANEMLKTEEIEQLLSDLSKCDNPYNCPHGRPTLIKLTKNEVEKMFKRK